MKTIPMTREVFIGRNIPAHATRMVHKATGIEIFYYSESSRHIAAIFAGRKARPVFWHSFMTLQALEQAVKTHLAYAEKRVLDDKARAERPIDVQIGDIFHSTWGYDQANHNFYEVTKIIGSRMVEIREIGTIQEDGGCWGHYRCIPQSGKFIGEPMRKRVQAPWHPDGAPSIRLASYSIATRWGKRIAGVVVGAPENGTNYA